MNRKSIASLCIGLTLIGSGNSIAADDAPTFSRWVDESGNISLPVNFRMTMVHLGSWFVPKGDASGFHDVYTEASSAAAFRKTGEFPDGATLVKELRGHDTGTYTTGANVASANSNLKQWFVMVKDSTGRFPDNPVWGEGWGWALFKTGDQQVNVAKDFKVDCLGCHIPAKSTDYVYVDAYPTLAR